MRRDQVTQPGRFRLSVGPTLSTQVDVALVPARMVSAVTGAPARGGAAAPVRDRREPVDRLELLGGGPGGGQPELPPEPLIDRVLRAVRTFRRAGPPGWMLALAIFAVTRGITYVFVQGVSRFQSANRFTEAHPDYLQMVAHWWDAGRYSTIATGGYPNPVPRYPTGEVMRNQLAFYPAYPRTVREMMIAFGMSWAVAGVILSLICGALAVIVMHSLVARVAGRTLATWTVVLFCVFPASPVLQFTYTESMATLLLVTALWCLQRRWYLPGIPVVLVTGFARPIGAPLVAVIGVHLLLRLYQRLRWAEPLRWHALVGLVLLLGSSVFATFEWPLTAGRLTGDPSAYYETMAAWRTNGQLTPVQPWFDRFGQFLGQSVGPVVVVVCALAYVYWLTRRSSRLIGADLLTWCLAYAGYLFLVLDPTTSLIRYLLPLFPLGTLLLAASPARAYHRAVALAFLAMQLVWLAELWRLDPLRIWPP